MYNKYMKTLVVYFSRADGFNMSGSAARTDDGIKKLDNWLESLGY